MTALTIACATDVGRVRQANEDAYVNADHPDPTVTATRGRLLVVADGMGGALGGGTASNLAAHTLVQVYFSETELPIAEALARATHAANTAIFEQAQGDENLRGMGSTLTAAVILDRQVWLAQVGDSRGYLIRQGEARQLTRDHSKVGMLLHDGLITPEQAANHPERNVILRSMGPHPTVEVDIEGPIELIDGDALLLCSDGLHGHLRLDELGPRMTGAPDQVVQALVELANARGGEDNITVALAVLGRLPKARAVPTTDPRRRDIGDTRHGILALPSGLSGRQKALMVGAVVLAAALLAFVLWQTAAPVPSKDAGPKPAKADAATVDPVWDAAPMTGGDPEDQPEGGAGGPHPFPGPGSPPVPSKPKEGKDKGAKAAPSGPVSQAPPSAAQGSNLTKLLDEPEPKPVGPLAPATEPKREPVAP